VGGDRSVAIGQVPGAADDRRAALHDAVDDLRAGALAAEIRHLVEAITWLRE